MPGQAYLLAHGTVAPVRKLCHPREETRAHRHFLQVLRVASVREPYSQHIEEARGAFVLVGYVEELALASGQVHVVARGPVQGDVVAHLHILDSRHTAQSFHQRDVGGRIRTPEVGVGELLVFVARLVIDCLVVLEGYDLDQAHQEGAHRYLHEEQRQLPYSLVFLIVAYCGSDGDAGVQARRHQGGHDEHQRHYQSQHGV